MTIEPERPLAVLAACLLAAGCGGCGRTSRRARLTSAATRGEQTVTAPGEETKLDYDRDTDGAHPDQDELSKPPPGDRDGDFDSAAKTRFDSDDGSVVHFGRAASASETAQIAPLIRRYYRYAAAGNGAGACSMLYSTFAEAVPEDYGTSPPGPAYARGTTCAAVLTAIFRHYHAEIAARLPLLRVSLVRIKERQGVAVLSFGAMPEREIHVVREGHAWRMLALTDDRLP